MRSMQGDCMFELPCLRNVLRGYFFVSAILLFSLSCAAQSPAFYRYTKESGLACEEIYELHQDKKGFMWIATDRGVFRYDGYFFQPFTTAQGLTDNTVFRFYEDEQSRMWLIPFNGELCYIENDRVIRYQYNDSITGHIDGVSVIRSIDVLPDGGLRLGMMLNGLIEISSTGRITKICPEEVDQYARVYWCEQNSDGELLIGNSQGTSGSSEYGWFYSCGSLRISQALEGGSSHAHQAGIVRADGTVIFTMGPQVVQIAPDGSVQSRDFLSNILSVTEDAQHRLWFGTVGMGALQFPADASPVSSAYEQFYAGETITCILEDNEGAFWLATHHNGLLYLPDVAARAWTFFEHDESCALLPDDNGTMYVLWRDHGITSVAPDSTRVYSMDGITSSFRALCWNEKQNQILVGAAGGAYAIDPVSGEATLIVHRAVNSIEENKNRIYLGLSWKLMCRQSDGTTSMLQAGGVRHRPDVLYTDCQGQLWMGGLDGLYKVHDTTLESQASAHELFTRRISGICELNDSTLVVATQSNGIVFMRNGKIRTLTQAEGFACNHIHGVSPGTGNTLWCSANDGLYEIFIGADTISFRTFPALKSVTSGGGKPCFVAATHELWLCNGNRVIAFNPDKIISSASSPAIYITSVIGAGNQQYSLDSIQLNHDENSIRINFRGLAFRLQGHVQYRYRLIGSSEEWQLTDQSAVEFAALEAGEYVFEVQAQNENGVWSANPASVSFIIIPPLWKTWWFIMAITIVCGVLMYVTIVWRFRSIRKRDLLREQALIFRQQALASQMNPHFIFNSLNTIQSLVLKEEKTKALDMFNSFAVLLRKSLEHSTERYISLEEELRMLQLYFEIEEMRFEGLLEYGVVLGHGVEPELMSVPAMLIQPMVENAVIHGIRKREGGGKVEVRFFFRGAQLICEIDDNGAGRSAGAKSEQHISAGLRITRDRLRVLSQMNKAEYSLEIIDKRDSLHNKPSGTTVRLVLPFVTDKSFTHEPLTFYSQGSGKRNSKTKNHV